MSGRTRVSTLALIAVVALGASWLVLVLLERRGVHLGAVPWVVAPVLLVVGVLTLWAASLVRAFLQGKRPSLPGTRAFVIAVLTKSVSLTGAVLCGWYGGQVLLAVANLQVESQQSRALSAGAATVGAVLLSIAGLVGETFCRLRPPTDGLSAGDMSEDGVHD